MFRRHTSTGDTRHHTLLSSHGLRASSGSSTSLLDYRYLLCHPIPLCCNVAPAARHSESQHSHSNGRTAAAARPTDSGGHPADYPAAGPQPTPSRPALPAVEDVLELECSRLGTGGVGICLWGSSGWVVLVQRALPGELLRCRVTAVNKGYGEAVKVATLRPHANAVPAPCQHYGPCGGCTLQDLAYDRQLQLKAEQVAQLFRRVGKLPAEAVAATMQSPVPAPALFSHRNKLQFTFSSKTYLPGGNLGEGEVVGGAALGFLRPGHADQVLPIRECLLQGPAGNAVLAVVQQVCCEQQLMPADDPGGAGFMKHLIIRSSSSSSSSDLRGAVPGNLNLPEQLMVVLVTTDSCRSEQMQPLVTALQERVPEVVSVVHSIQATAPATAGRSSSSSSSSSSRRTGDVNGGLRRSGRRTVQQAQRVGGEADDEDGMSDSGSSRQLQGSRSRRALAVSSSNVLWGKPMLTQRLCGLDFDISAHSFFQTNVGAAELLYGCIAAACNPRSTDVLLDLYCGTGTIGLSLASQVRQVVGFDVSASSIADAQANAARNGILNARFVCGNLDQLAARGLAEAPAAAAAAGATNSFGGGTARRRQPEHKQQGRNQGGRRERGRSAGQVSSDLPAAMGPAMQPDIVIVDPARAGLGMPVVRYLLSSTSARRVVYVSCNAATQARDLQRLCEPAHGFRLVAWTAVDMFPHTDHVETVAVLDRAV